MLSCRLISHHYPTTKKVGRLKISKYIAYFDYPAIKMHIVKGTTYSDEIRGICRQNSREALEEFIQQNRETDPDYSPPLRKLLLGATDSRADNIAAYCLENGQVAYDAVMTSVVVNDSFAVYRLIVEHKAVDINYVVPWYGDILGVKAAGNQLDWVKFCLEHGADPNRNLVGEYLSALSCAASTGSIQMVDLLLQHGARLKGSNAIVEAAIYGNLEMVKHLLSKGADIDEVGIEGPAGDECYDDMGSPLHQAAMEGHTRLALFLIDAGANIHLKNPVGRTAEDIALEKDHTEILEALRRKLRTAKE
ncbi:ankyrin repeat-containing domain protein [Aspergillus pseudodeflectus]|uniref:Ankyrin repeat-containing domain protein n=1 Tax=Aspergillus pseudodeflectus TaxID=176178 RepID=A0ABR4JPG6_9EURO